MRGIQVIGTCCSGLYNLFTLYQVCQHLNNPISTQIYTQLKAKSRLSDSLYLTIWTKCLQWQSAKGWLINLRFWVLFYCSFFFLIKICNYYSKLFIIQYEQNYTWHVNVTFVQRNKQYTSVRFVNTIMLYENMCTILLGT